jgi:hypothetical protein
MENSVFNIKEQKDKSNKLQKKCYMPNRRLFEMERKSLLVAWRLKTVPWGHALDLRVSTSSHRFPASTVIRCFEFAAHVHWNIMLQPEFHYIIITFLIKKLRSTSSERNNTRQKLIIIFPNETALLQLI